MLLELQLNNPMLNLGQRDGEWCIGRDVQDQVGLSHRSHSAGILGLTQEGGLEKHGHQTLALALKVTSGT
jgi:hypothetical protein